MGKEMTIVECAKLAKDRGMTYGQMQSKLTNLGLSWEEYKRLDYKESTFVTHVKEECRRIRSERGEE